MIIALLALLGVSLWVLLALVALMLFPPPVPDEVRRMGESPVVVRMVLADGSEIAVALRHEDAALALGGAAPVGQTRLTPR